MTTQPAATRRNLTLYVNPELVKRLKALADKEGRSLNNYTERLLQQALNDQPKEAK